MKAGLLAWYDRHRRGLPWRAEPGRTAEPWPVLVSEVMLQQTTVATVSGRFGPFLTRFPTPAAMAEAPIDAVMHAWQGLGYYRRARALHACAQRILAAHDGRVPTGLEELLALPGLGRYTAHAVAAIAFGRAVVPVDANVTRVLVRLTGRREPVDKLRGAIEATAQALAHETRASDMAQALMELGALVCKPRAPRCGECPWQGDCVAKLEGVAEELPRHPPKKARQRLSATACLVLDPADRILFERRPAQGLLGGMITLPMTGMVAPDDPEPSIPLAGLDFRPLPGSVQHVFTHIELTVRVLVGRATEPMPGIWTHRLDLATLALPTLTKKLLRHAGVMGET